MNRYARWSARLGWMLALVLLWSCARPLRCARGTDADVSPTRPVSSPAPSNRVTLVVTAGLVGYLEPCGCSPDQRGGVARAAQAVAQLRAEGQPVVLIDAGDRFFADAHAPDDVLVARQHRAQAEAMADVTRALRYDVLTLTDRDAAAGISFFGTQQLPPLLDAGSGTVAGARSSVMIETGHLRIGAFAVGSGDALDLLTARARTVREAGADIAVGIVYRGLDGTRALVPAAAAAGVDLLIAARADVPAQHASGALADLHPPVFTVAARGEEILRIDLQLDGARGAPLVRSVGAADRAVELDALAQRIELARDAVKQMSPDDPAKALRIEKMLELEARRSNLAAQPPPGFVAGQRAFSFTFVPLSPQLPKEPAVQQLVDTYTQRVNTDNAAWAKDHPQACPKARKGEAEYVGGETCQACHEDPHAVWGKTRHAHAYQTLVDKNRQFDTACVGCHVTGYQKPGGACDIVQVQGRTDVQCEACHGPGSLHVDAASEGASEAKLRTLIRREVPEAQCRTCHDPSNSPHFVDSVYRPRILGPGHQAR